MERMKKTNAVKEVMGNMLSPYGFRYAGYKHKRWTFCREVDGVTQNVVIQGGLTPQDKSYILEIGVKGRKPLRVPEFVKDMPWSSQVWYYENEEERLGVLKKLGELVIAHGLDAMVEEAKKIVRHDFATEEMEVRLYQDNLPLTEAYKEKHGLTEASEEAILECVKSELDQIAGKEFTEVQEQLVEVAAVLGNTLIGRLGGSWKYHPRTGIHTSIECKPLFPSITILDIAIRSWEQGGGEHVIKHYKHFVEYHEDWVAKVRMVYGTKK